MSDYMSIDGEKSIARKCCCKLSFSLCCCLTRCLQSLSSTRWLWYGLGNEAREARRVSRNVTPHRPSEYSTRLVTTTRTWIASESSHEKENSTAHHPYIDSDSVPSCVLLRLMSVVQSPLLLSPHFVQTNSNHAAKKDQGILDRHAPKCDE